MNSDKLDTTEPDKHDFKEAAAKLGMHLLKLVNDVLMVWTAIIVGTAFSSFWIGLCMWISLLLVMTALVTDGSDVHELLLDKQKLKDRVVEVVHLDAIINLVIFFAARLCFG